MRKGRFVVLIWTVPELNECCLRFQGCSRGMGAREFFEVHFGTAFHYTCDHKSMQKSMPTKWFELMPKMIRKWCQNGSRHHDFWILFMKTRIYEDVVWVRKYIRKWCQHGSKHLDCWILFMKKWIYEMWNPSTIDRTKRKNKRKQRIELLLHSTITLELVEQTIVKSCKPSSSSGMLRYWHSRGQAANYRAMIWSSYAGQNRYWSQIGVFCLIMSFSSLAAEAWGQSGWAQPSPKNEEAV